MVNGGPASAMAERAAAFAARLGPGFETTILYRATGKIRPVPALVGDLLRFRPAACYVLDMAAAGVLAAGVVKATTGSRVVIDTGDAIVDLGRVLGRGPVGIALTQALEEFGIRVADRVVVRGSHHRDLFARRGVRAVFVPDGVDPGAFARPPDPTVRRKLGLDGFITVGLVGSTVWVPAVGRCYGSELLDLLRLMKDEPVAGVLVGDGSGLPVLRQKCREYGIEDRVRFVGRVPYSALPDYLGAMDVCLSTQSDDVIGRVRTTGKLPLYMAAGKFILASRVGEAARILPPEMLVDYHGRVDPDYPARLRDRLRALLAGGTDLRVWNEGPVLAREHFDYDRLTARVRTVLLDVTDGLPARGPVTPDTSGLRARTTGR